MFLYALSYVSFEKCMSTFLGTRIRGVYNPSNLESLFNHRFVKDVYLVRVFAQLSNFVYVYKLLKKYQDIKFMVSYTRVQSRLTGYACKMYVPVCFRSPFFGLFSYVYGVKIEEATRKYSEYTTFTDFFTRTLKPGARSIDRVNDAYSLCSPCDGAVLTSGTINSVDSTIDCVKGRSYRLDEFMIGVIGDDGDQDCTSRV